MLRRTAQLAGSLMVLAAMLTFVGGAVAAPAALLTIGVPNAKVPVVEFGSAAKLTATLTSDVATVAIAGQPVTLLADPWPFDGVYTSVATATTSAEGTVELAPTPVRNTNYRLDWSAIDTAATPATATTVSSPIALIYTDLKMIAFSSGFANNGHYLATLKGRGDATLKLSKQAAYLYVRINKRGSWKRQATALPRTSGSLRVWKFNTIIRNIDVGDTVNSFLCSKDQPAIFGIGRVGIAPFCGKATVTNAAVVG